MLKKYRRQITAEGERFAWGRLYTHLRHIMRQKVERRLAEDRAAVQVPLVEVGVRRPHEGGDEDNEEPPVRRVRLDGNYRCQHSFSLLLTD